MPIDPSVLRPRVPRLGSITVGRGVAATSTRTGKDYARPQRESTLVFHTNDGLLADAVHTKFGGTIHRDSPTWDYDVVTAATEVPVSTLISLFRQDLVQYAAAKTVRRCDGTTVTTVDGRPSGGPCLCKVEMAAGAERACAPETVMPVLLDLDVDRMGTWEVRSVSWGTAANIAGTLRLLLATGWKSEVPAILSMRTRTVRDRNDKVWEVPELHLTPAVTLAALASGQVQALPGQDDGGSRGELEAGPSEDERAAATLLDVWQNLFERASAVGAAGEVRGWWAKQLPGRAPAELGVAELRLAVDATRAIVDAAEPRHVKAAVPVRVGSGPDGWPWREGCVQCAGLACDVPFSPSEAAAHLAGTHDVTVVVDVEAAGGVQSAAEPPGEGEGYVDEGDGQGAAGGASEPVAEGDGPVPCPECDGVGTVGDGDQCPGCLGWGTAS